MVEVQISGNPTEEEAAACLAVICLLCAPAATAASDNIPERNRTQSSPWGRAARLEQTGTKAGKSHSQTLWGLSGRTGDGLLAVVALVLSAAALTLSALPANALERINPQSSQGGGGMSAPPGSEFTSAAGPGQDVRSAATGRDCERNNASCFEPATQQQQSAESPSQGSPGVNRPRVRVALTMSAAKIALSCPDGATIHNCVSGALIAQLPPRSTWDVCRRQTSTSTSQLCFSGNIGNCAFSRVVVDRTLNTASSPFRSAAFQKSNDSGFQPQILDGATPEFSLNLRIGPGAVVRDGGTPSYRAIGFSAAAAEPGGSTAGSAASTEPPVSFIVTPTRPDGLIGFNNKLYRGRIELRASATTPQLAVINVVNMEDYLLSVVPAEMPGSWPLESLKAQAIAARSYAVANIGKHAAEGYDVESTVNDQVYGGVEPETENSNLAVAETEGLVLKHQDKVVSAFFHSAGGGCTELAEHVWGRPVPYLKSVADYDDLSPHFSWTRQFPVSAADDCLKKSGKEIGALLSVMPLVRSASGRLKSAMLIGTNGPVIVSGEELRRIFSLPSSLFNACIDNDCYVFAGRGFGHGLGMSQWGAKSLAEQGYNAAQILSYYYKDVSIDQL